MKTAIRYYTHSGNTKKLADAIGAALSLQAETVDTPLTEKVDLLLLGCSYYAFDMDPNVKTFLRENKDKIGKVICFGTSAMNKSMKKPLKKVLDELNVAQAEEDFHCPGSFGPMHKGRPNADDMKAAQEFAVRMTAK